MLNQGLKKKPKTVIVERRRFLRHDIELNAYLTLSKHKKPLNVTLHNISEGGAFIETNEVLKPADLIHLSIELAPGLITIDTDAKVIFCASKTALSEEQSISDIDKMEIYVRRGHLTGCGVQFQNLSSKDKKFIHNFVEAIT